jgi:circadian clock protein KaiB
MASAFVRLRLYVAGDKLNSRLAIDNLNALCQEHLAGRHSIEVVDVLLEPRRALDDDVQLMPSLVVLSRDPRRIIVGTLSRSDVVLGALGLSGKQPA